LSEKQGTLAVIYQIQSKGHYLLMPCPKRH